MGLSSSIDRAALGLYVMGLIAAISLVFGIPWRGSLDAMSSGTVEIAGEFAKQHPSAPADALPWMLIALLFALALIVHQRRWLGILAAGVVVAADAVFAFIVGPRYGLLFAPSLQLVFHAIVLWWLAQAFTAVNQMRTNEGIARDLEATHRLWRALDETDAPPPPAARFTTRYRPAPPR